MCLVLNRLMVVSLLQCVHFEFAVVTDIRVTNLERKEKIPGLWIIL